MARFTDRTISRRRFAQLGAAAVAGAAVVAMTGCNAEKIESQLEHTAGIKGELREVVDDAGRTVQIPAVVDLEKVFCTSALAQFFISTLTPELLGATTGSFTADDLKYLPEGTGDLPNLGSLTNGTLNREGLLLEEIQLVFSISAVELTQQNISDAEDLQSQSGIPVVLIDGSMDKITECYRFLGECLGATERAEELASYCERVYNDVNAAMEGLPDEERPRLYYAEGAEGLNSEPRGNQHALVFDVAGAYNVVGEEETEDIGMVPISMEQVLRWNPQVIVAWSKETRSGADEDIRASAEWGVLDAVKNGFVYTMPDTPFAWLDRPGASNRFLGLQWMANLLHPDRYPCDIVAVVKEFYQLFYHVEVTDDEVYGWLGNSYPAPAAGSMLA